MRPLVVTKAKAGDHPTVKLLTLEAMAALQSFPSNYQWGGSQVKALEAIGNAVPPLLMQRVIEANQSLA